MHVSHTVSAILALAAIACTGCVVPTSQNPLSDDANSIIDERLIGHWLPMTKEVASPNPAAELVAVGRADGSQTKLEAVFTQVHDQRPTMTRLPFYVTEIDGRHYISITSDQPNSGYLVMHYRFHDPQAGQPPTFDLYSLDSDFVVKSIDGGKLAGEVRRKDNSIQKMTITSKPAELAEFLKKHAGEAFGKEPLVLRRVER